MHPACDDAGSRFLGRGSEAREEGGDEAKHAWLRQRLELFCSGSGAAMASENSLARTIPGTGKN